MEKIVTGALFAIHVVAEKPWSDYTEQEQDGLAKRLVYSGLSGSLTPPPLHLRMLIEQKDTSGQWWQTWVATGAQELAFNGPQLEPIPLLVPVEEVTD